MDSNYIITSSGAFVNIDELYHYGVKNMKWGIRRYQNPDGSLTPAGKKRYTNADGSLNKKGVKKFGDSVKSEKSSGTSSGSSSGSKATSKNKVSDMSDSELQSKVNRLRNEEAYRDLSKKLGYDSPKTELDAKIEMMEKQKKYLELQRDINDLTPKKVSKGKEIVNTLIDKAVIPAVTEAGKSVLSNYLTKAGANAIKKALGKTTAKIDADVKRAYAKEQAKLNREQAQQKAKADKNKAKQEAKAAQKQAKADKNKAKQEAKAAQKQTREGAKKTAESSKMYKGTVEGEGTSRSTNKTRKGPIIDVEDYTEAYSNKPITSLSKTSKQKGYEYVDKIKTDYGYRYVYELPSPNVAGYLHAPKDDD